MFLRILIRRQGFKHPANFLFLESTVNITVIEIFYWSIVLLFINFSCQHIKKVLFLGFRWSYFSALALWCLFNLPTFFFIQVRLFYLLALLAHQTVTGRTKSTEYCALADIECLTIFILGAWVVGLDLYDKWLYYFGWINDINVL
jgi:hypothetical protein